MTSSSAPLSWVKEIQSTLIDAGAFPSSGLPSFPWEEFSKKIGALLHFADLKIFPRQTSFLQSGAVTSGLGSGFISMAFDLTPLQSPVFWLMGKEEVAKLTTLVLSQEGKGFSSPKFQEGFYFYLGTEAALALSELNAFGTLALEIAKPAPPPQEEALCIDVEIQHAKQTFWGRLVCPASFHSAFKAHFMSEPPPSLTSALAEQIDVSVQIELGQTTLSQGEWAKVRVGDFIILDGCSFDPETQKAAATLKLEQAPLFRVRIKDNSLKIVDYAMYREEKEVMTSKDEEIGPLEELPEETQEDEKHLWSSENPEAEKMISAKEVPLTISVEIARLRINLDKLLHLSPGDVLELPVRPEQGVDLVISGKKVAKAELVKLGEMLGVKILQMG